SIHFLPCGEIMPYDEQTAKRIRKRMSRRQGVQEKKMFGGVGFMLNGNMCVGAWKEFLILRIGLDAYEDGLNQPFVQEFDITGRAMRGWIMIHPDGFAEDDDLADWIRQAVQFVKTLPAK
ncbi:MAG: TfoX/Sxy family protein, partial [Planctomycetales bacterium]